MPNEASGTFHHQADAPVEKHAALHSGSCREGAAGALLIPGLPKQNLLDLLFRDEVAHSVLDVPLHAGKGFLVHMLQPHPSWHRVVSLGHTQPDVRAGKFEKSRYQRLEVIHGAGQ